MISTMSMNLCGSGVLFCCHLSIFAKSRFCIITLPHAVVTALTSENDIFSVNFLQLSGSAAVQCKNVNLRLVDNHTGVMNHGVVQLFTEPHPHRIPTYTSIQPAPPRLPKNMFIPVSNGGLSRFIFLLYLQVFSHTK